MPPETVAFRSPPGALLALLTLLALVALAACGEAPAGDERRVSELEAVAQRAVSSRNFGVHCATSSYEDNWRTTIGEAGTICDRFAAEAAEEATQEFYYNLVNKEFYWETGGDGYDNSIEDVDLFFAVTHGYAQTSSAQWAMWNNNDYASSSSMVLGDELRGTSAFVTYSPHVLTQDANTWTRWDSVFGGGLRITLASHGTVYWGSAERDVGKVFAQYLNAGYSFKTSWAMGFDSMAYNHNDVAVMATGTSSSNCTQRRDNLSWDNFSYSAFPRLESGDIGTWCAYVWDNI